MKNVSEQDNKRMSASMDRIVELSGAIYTKERELNSERIALCMQIQDWIKVATACGAVETIARCYEFISRRSKRLAPATICKMYRIACYIEAHKLDPAVVDYSAIALSSSYTLTPSVRHQVDAAVRTGQPTNAVRKLIFNDVLVRKSMAHNRAEAAVAAGTLTKDQLRIEMMAVQTMARKLFGKQNIIVSVTDDEFVPLVTVGYAKRVLA